MIQAAQRLMFVCLFLLVPLASAQTIWEVAQDNSDLSMLVQAVEAAGLSDTLSGEGPFTLFAPTNEAFEKLPQGQLNALLENSDALTQILTYHLVPERFATSDISADMTEFETVQGSPLPITQIGVGQAAVIEVNIEASNGVIYLIDSVLTPPDFEMAGFESGGAAGSDMAGSMTGGAAGDTTAGLDYSSPATRTMRYAILPQAESGVSGSALIAEYGPQTVVTLLLNGTPAGGMHPAELRAGDCGEAGEVILPLENVDGSTGFSTTITDTSFSTIVDNDHALNVYLSPDSTENAIACGEVGAGADSDMTGAADTSAPVSGGISGGSVGQ